MSNRYRQQEIRLTWVMLVLSFGASATILVSHPTLAEVFALLATAASLFLLARQSQRLITDCSELSFKWSGLGIEYKALWDGMYSEEAPAKFRVLDEKFDELSKVGHSLPYKPELTLKWQVHAQQQHRLPMAA